MALRSGAVPSESWEFHSSPRQQRAEQVGASSCQPTSPCHTPIIHQHYLFIILWSMMLQTQARCVIKEETSPVGQKKAYVPAHILLFVEFSKTSQPHPLGFAWLHSKASVLTRCFQDQSLLYSGDQPWEVLSADFTCAAARSFPSPSVWWVPSWAQQLEMIKTSVHPQRVRFHKRFPVYAKTVWEIIPWGWTSNPKKKKNPKKITCADWFSFSGAGIWAGKLSRGANCCIVVPAGLSLHGSH